MGDINDLTNSEIKKLIKDRLKGSGVDFDLITIRKKGSHLLVKGGIESRNDRNIIIEAIIDVTGTEDITDELVLLPGLEEDYGDDDMGLEIDRDGDIYDEDHECLGTEDVFRSLEEGMPYIPPDESPFDGSFGGQKRRKRRKGYY